MSGQTGSAAKIRNLLRSLFQTLSDHFRLVYSTAANNVQSLPITAGECQTLWRYTDWNGAEINPFRAEHAHTLGTRDIQTACFVNNKTIPVRCCKITRVRQRAIGVHVITDDIGPVHCVESFFIGTELNPVWRSQIVAGDDKLTAGFDVKQKWFAPSGIGRNAPLPGTVSVK